MGSEPRISLQGLKVLRVFLDTYEQSVRERLAGADIMRLAKLSSGTMYPLLGRFEDAGLLESKWEDRDPQDLGRPRRRLYRLTGAGAKAARYHLSEAMGVFGLPRAGEV
jgi:DNA-binding PadR family transcriptional regulator